MADLSRFRQEVEAGGAALSCEVTLTSVPAYDVVALRMALASYDDERLAWERLGACMKERGIAPSEPYTEFCEFCDEGLEGAAGAADREVGDEPAGAEDSEGAAEGASNGAMTATAPDVDAPFVVVEVAVATDARGEDDGLLRFYRSAALPCAASIKVYGPFENIGPVYASFARWLEVHPTLRMAGPTREVAHRGPWNADDPQDYLTELLVPVEERAG